MKEHFSLIKIENKLRSLSRVAGGSGIVFQSGEHTYAYPETLYQTDLSSSFEKHDNTKVVPLRNGKLIIIDPSPSLDEQNLTFLSEELQDEIQLASIFDTILEANIAISSNLNLKTVLHIVMSLSEEILNPEVSSVMLLSADKKELYWEISRGDKSEFFKETVTLPVGEGIGGYVAQTGESVLVNDVDEDPRWSRNYDEESGFHTRSMICVPIKFHGEILGVINVINKRTGEFTSGDLRILEILAAQTGGAIDNARIHGELEEAYEELKVLDKAKERVINHLSHELKTPLSLISGVFKIIARDIEKSGNTSLEKHLKRGERNLDRLLDLQAKMDDILNQRPVEEKEKIIHVIEDAACFLEELEAENRGGDADIIRRISDRLDSLFCRREIRVEEIPLKAFLHDLCDEGILSMRKRDLNIIRNFEKEITLNMDREVLKEVFMGLLKNAIENTPDGGDIEVRATATGNQIRIDVQDYGVGITSENRQMIFGGFFHTQETDFYSSKRPFEFNAGGSGSDLLRTKIFSERFGFSVDFESTRCRFIPEDRDMCPGQISSCRFIEKKSECLASGGSTFSLRFMPGRVKDY